MFDRFFRSKQSETPLVDGSRSDILAQRRVVEQRCRYLACIAMDSFDHDARARVLEEYTQLQASLQNPRQPQ